MCSVWSSTWGQHLRNGISLAALLGNVGAAQLSPGCDPIFPPCEAGDCSRDLLRAGLGGVCGSERLQKVEKMKAFS